MGILFRKQKEVIHKIEDYLSQIDRCVELFQKCLEQLINQGESFQNDEMVESVHKAESRADDLRREIERELYQKALIPESRGDILGIIETIDKIPNQLESVCYQIHLQKIVIPDEYRKDFFRLIKTNIESYTLLRKATRGLFYKTDVMEQIMAIDAKESESDVIERDIIRKIFSSAMEKADKILLKEIVINIGSISDEAQSVSDRLALAIIKRRI